MPASLTAKIKQLARQVRQRLRAETALAVVWNRKDPSSWLGRHLPDAVLHPPRLPEASLIESIATKTESLGAQPLWEGYRAVYERNPETPWAQQEMARSSEQVRSQPLTGQFFTWLATTRKPGLIVEIGTAFGVSGMYWLSGLKAADSGRLLTFDPNEVWHKIAVRNMAQISDRFTAVLGTFEEHFAAHGEETGIDLAFVDAIHTSEFVIAQVNILLPRLAPGALLLLDDISFSEDMAACWRRLAADSRFRASASLANRLGILELPAA